ncbi:MULTISPECIES: hypothetical protein [unclassified Phyllobacterium]|uniref:hypothetical protein n=1 Tax=unclassified Phyllobacterium TaxID=2638441 RepID=UPI0030131C47
MTEYNFISDFLDTFQSSPDWIKALWLLIPPGFLLGLIAMAMRFSIAKTQVAPREQGELIYSVHRDAGNQLHIVRHIPLVDGNPALLMLDPLSNSEPASQNPNRLAPPA